MQNDKNKINDSTIMLIVIYAECERRFAQKQCVRVNKKKSANGNV